MLSFARASGGLAMDEALVAILGTVGTTLSALSLVPQTIKTWRTRSAADISAGWLVLALISMLVWIAYGIIGGAQAVIWSNVLTLGQAGFILAIKWRGAPRSS